MVIGRNGPIYKRVCIYVSQQYSGYKLKDIGVHFDMRGSAVSQSNRGLKKGIDLEKKVKKKLKEITDMLRPDT